MRERRRNPRSLGRGGCQEGYWDQVRREKTLIMDKYAEGKAEGDELATHRIAKNMLQHGASIDLVVNSTGLTRVEVETIKVATID